MQTETHHAPEKLKRPEGREFYAVNFDLREFRQKHPDIRRAKIGERLGLSAQSLDNYDRKRCPISVYKAIIEAFAPNDAHDYELKLLVSENRRSFYITQQTTALAKAYDQRRAGSKITLADGTGYYQIAPEQKDAAVTVRRDDLPIMLDMEVPLGTTAPVEEVVGTIMPEPQNASPEQAVLLQQQE